MVNRTQAFRTEKEIMRILEHSGKLTKYGLVLHEESQYGIDIRATGKGYAGLAIEVESCEQNWTAEHPYPPSWVKGFTVPTRKLKFFQENPLSIYVKVNSGITRAAVVPMAFVFSSEIINNGKSVAGSFSNFRCQEFYTIKDPDHPAIAYIRVEDLPSVIDGLFKHISGIRKLNAKYTDMRPIFRKEKENAKI